MFFLFSCTFREQFVFGFDDDDDDDDDVMMMEGARIAQT